MRRRLLVTFLLSLLFLSISYSVEISDCGKLDQGNTVYILNQSIDTTATTCFSVSAQNVTLDCQGNSISFSGSGSSVGVDVNGYNFKLINCTVSGWTYGIKGNINNFGVGYKVYVNDSKFIDNYYSFSTHGGAAYRVVINDSYVGITNSLEGFDIYDSTIDHAFVAFVQGVKATNVTVLNSYKIVSNSAVFNLSKIKNFGILVDSGTAYLYSSNVSNGIFLSRSGGTIGGSNSYYKNIMYPLISYNLSSRVYNLSDKFNFNFSIYSLSNSSELESDSYELYLGDNLVSFGNSSKVSVELEFPDTYGMYPIRVIVNDSDNNTRELYVPIYASGFLDEKHTLYYLRPEVYSVHGQPYGDIYKSAKFETPSTTYSFDSTSYLAVWTDDIPISAPMILNSTYFYFRYIMNDTAYFYTEFPGLDDSNGDYCYEVPNASSETLINDTLNHRYYVDYPFFLYFFSYKLGAMNSTKSINVTWITENTRILPDPSWFNLTYFVPMYISSAVGEGTIYEYNWTEDRIYLHLNSDGKFEISITLPSSYNWFMVCDGSYSCDSVNYTQKGTTAEISSIGDHKIELVEGCTCDSCSSCTNALLDSSCPTVYLIQDISTTSTCISQNSYSNKLFDCQNHKITGDSGAGDFGIYFDNSENITVENCDIEYFDVGIVAIGKNIDVRNCTLAHMHSASYDMGFLAYNGENLSIYNSTVFDIWYGIMYQNVTDGDIKYNLIHDVWTGGTSSRNSSIYITNSTGIDIENNEIYNYGVGIRVNDDDPGNKYMGHSFNIVLKHNHVYNNSIGIYFENSTAEEISNNWVCGNLNYDIYFDSTASYSSAGDDTCNLVNNFNDDGYSSCRWPCNSTCTCSDYGGCDNYLAAPHSCWKTILNQSLLLTTPFNFYVSGKTFDCNNSILSTNEHDVKAFYVGSKDCIKIQNCIISRFFVGVDIDHSNVSIENTTFSYNWFGIKSVNGGNLSTKNVFFFRNRVGVALKSYRNVNLTLTNFTRNFCGLYLPLDKSNDLTNFNIYLSDVFFNGKKGYAFHGGTHSIDAAGFLFVKDAAVNVSDLSLENLCTGVYINSNDTVRVGNVYGSGNLYLEGNVIFSGIINISRAVLYGIIDKFGNVFPQIYLSNIIPIDEKESTPILSNGSYKIHASKAQVSNESNSNSSFYYLEKVDDESPEGNYTYIDVMNEMLDNVPVFNTHDIELNFTVMYPNGTTCTNYSYKIYLGGEDVTQYSSSSGSKITLNYTVDSDGYYTVELILNESNISLVHSWPVLVGTTHNKIVEYYVTQEVPKYSQPTGISSLAFGTLSPYKPLDEVVIKNDMVVYLVPNEIPFMLPTILVSVNYNLNTSSTGETNSITVERYGSYSSGSESGWILLGSGTYNLYSPIDSPLDMLWLFIKFKSYSVMQTDVVKPGYPEIHSSYRNPSIVGFVYMVPDFLVNFESTLDAAVDYIKKNENGFSIKTNGEPINLSLNLSTVSNSFDKFFVESSLGICPNSECDYLVKDGILNLTFDSSKVNVILDTQSPKIISENPPYVNSTEFNLKFNSTDNFFTYSYVDFNRSLKLALRFNNYTSLKDYSSYSRLVELHSSTGEEKDLPKEVRGIWSNALRFNGYTSYVYIPDAFSIGDGITVSAWIRPSNYEDTSWPMFEQNTNRTGYTNDLLSSHNVLWIQNIIGDPLAQPVYDNGKIFVGTYNISSGDGEFLALDAELGDVIWNKSFSVLLSSPAVYNGKVYVIDSNNVLHAFNEDDGSEIWNYTFPDTVYASILIYNGTIYVAEKSYRLYALNATNGDILWIANIGKYVENSAPVLADDTIITVSSDERLVYAFEAKAGKLIWKVNVGDNGDYSTPAFDGRAIFIATTNNNSGTFYVLDKSGKILCNVSLNDNTSTDYFPPAVVVDDKFAYVGWSHGIYVFNKYNCTPVWNITGDDKGVDIVSPIINDKFLFVTQKDGKVHQYYKENGTEVWNYSVGTNYSSIILVNQKLYFGGNGSFYAVGERRSTVNSIYLLGYQSDTEGYHWLYHYKGGSTLYWQYTNGTKWKTVHCSHSVNLYDGNWHMISVTHNYSTGEVKFYVDGELQCDEFSDPVLPVSSKSSYVGSYRTYAHFFKGDIDEVLVFDRILSDSEISTLYNSTDKEFSAQIYASDGTYDYTAVSVDEVGNDDSISDKITVDTEAPQVNLVSPQNDSCNSKDIVLNSTVSEDTLNDFIYNFSDDLVTYINFDEAKGTLLHDWIQNITYVIEDVNSSNYDGNTLPNWTDGKFGFGIKFDGVDDIAYHDFGSTENIPYNTSTLTISLWMKPIGCDSPWSRGCGVFGGFGDSYWCSGFGIYWNDKNQTYIVFGYGIDYARDPITYYHYKFLYDLTVNVSKDSWHMLTIVYDVPHRNMSVYVDGKYAASREIEEPFSLHTKYLHIGTSGISPYWATSRYATQNVTFNGTLDQILIWNRALTPKEIEELYNITYPLHGELSVLNKNLIAHFHFDEGSGSYSYDDTQYNYVVSLHNVTWTEGRSDFGLHFNGNDSYALVENSGNLTGDQITLAAWVKIDKFSEVNTYYYILDKGYYEGYKLYYYPNGAVYFAVRDSNDNMNVIYSPTNTIQEGKWYFVVATYDENVSKLFVNGKLVAYGNFSGYPVKKGDVNLMIGHIYYNTNNDHTLNGTIDEVLIFNKSLSDLEVEVLYHSLLYRYFANMSKVPDGKYVVNTYSEDYAGNLGNSENITFFVDTENPIIVYKSEDQNGSSICKQTEEIDLIPIDLTNLNVYSKFSNSFTALQDPKLILNLPMNEFNSSYESTKDLASELNFVYSGDFPDGNLGNLIGDFENELDGFSAGPHLYTYYVMGVVGYSVGVSSNTVNLTYLYKNVTGSYKANYTIWFYGKGYVNAGLYNGSEYVSYIEDVDTGCRTPLGETAIYNYCNEGDPYTEWHLFKIFKPNETSSDVILRLMNGNRTTSKYSGQYDYVVDGPIFVNDSFDAGLKFDGYRQKVIVSYPNELKANFSQFSVELWINSSPQQMKSQSNFITFGTWRNRIAEYNGKMHIEFYINGSPIAWKTGQVIPQGEPVHIVVVYNGSAVIDYVNGNKEIYNGSVSGPLDLSIGTYNLIFGSEGPFDYSWPFNGTIYTIRIYNKSLSDEEVNELYHGEKIYDRLIAAWNFDEFSHDYKTYDQHMVAKSIERNGAYFDGNNDHLSADVDESWKLQNFTFEAWVKFKDNPTHTWGAVIRGPWGSGYGTGWRLLARVSGSNAQYLFQLNNGTTTPRAIYSSSYPLDKWHFVAGTYDGHQICLYVDGELDNCLSAEGGVHYYSSGYPIRIGGAQYKLNGIIDNVRIYNRTLTADEIRNDYYILRDKYNVILRATSEGWKNYDVEAIDCCNNSNYLNLSYQFVSEDVEVTDVAMNNSNPKEGEEVLFTTQIFNPGWLSSNPSLELAIYSWDGSEWNKIVSKTDSFSLNVNESVTDSMTWIAKPCRYKFVAKAIPNTEECNTSNDEKEIIFDVPAWATIYGNLSSKLLLGTSESETMYVWNPANVANVFIADADSIFYITDLEPLPDIPATETADSALNMSGCQDSINELWDANRDKAFDMYHTFVIVGNSKNVPVIYSDSSHNFFTGILYDSADGAYDGSQDLVFIGNVNRTSSDYGLVDYVIKVPSNLQELKGSNRELYLYLEIT